MCHAGILGISVYSFDCKLYIDLLFFTSKNYTINSIYCKITGNVWLDLLQFFPVYSTWTFC